MKQPDYNKIINQLNTDNVWVEKRVDLSINADQYIALLKGYLPDWDMRYGIMFNHFDYYLYAYRSGYVVGKYQFRKNGIDSYTCTEMYDNPEKSDYLVLFEIIREACKIHQVDLDFRKLEEQMNKTRTMNTMNR